MKLTTHLPGVYFGMPEEEYHADPSFSSSVAKSILVSPLTAWCEHYDPEREEEQDTPARIKGKAAHKAVLEGLAAFQAVYAVRPDPEDYPEHLKGGPAIKARCKELSLSASGTLVEMSERILAEDPQAKLWPILEADFEARAAGRTILPADVGAYCKRIAQLVHANPHVNRAVNSGYPEVSIFWVEDGLPCKARIDYLKPRAGIDMKTFTNMFSKPLDRAVAHAVAQHRYHVQAAFHLRALRAAQDLSFETRAGAAGPAGRDFLAKDMRFIFLFVETGRIPNIALREFREKNESGQETLAHQAGAAAVDLAAGVWRDHMERFGIDQPWVDNAPLRAFDDQEFPLYMTE